MSGTWLLLAVLSAVGGEAAVKSGEVRYAAPASEEGVPERFRLPDHVFCYEQRPLATSAVRMVMSEVTFPSPVVTPHPNNNTVHCEYFRPAAPGKYPAVVVLHILGGDFPLSRVFCRTLAHHNVAALFVKLPYYGPREQPGSGMRMISADAPTTVSGLTQAVLDIRRAGAWLAAQEEVDDEQLGIFGISLGGITSALTATAEPRFKKVCMIEAGGDMATVAVRSPQFERERQAWLARGGKMEDAVAALESLKAVDPVTYGKNVQGRQMLMLNVLHDEIIPRECTDSLWHAFGEPRIIWWEAGHKSAARFLFDGLAHVTKFFQPDAATAKSE